MGYIKKFGVLSGLILIALGVVCYLLENQVVAFFGIAAGILLLVFGGYFLVGSLIQTQSGNMAVVTLIAGLLFLLSGLYLLLHSALMVRLTGVAIGIMAFAAGADRFAVAWSRMKAGVSRNKNLLFGGIHVVFGIVMCVVPKWGVDILVKFTGLYLIVAGVMVLFSALKYDDF